MNTENRNIATMLRRGFLAAVVALLISAHPHAPTGSAQSLSPALPAKEFVYVGSKLLAVEMPEKWGQFPASLKQSPNRGYTLSWQFEATNEYRK